MARRFLKQAVLLQSRRGDLPGIIWENAPSRITPEELARILRELTGSSKVALDRTVKRLPDPKRWLKNNLERQYWTRPVLAHGRHFKALDPGPEWKALKPWACYENAMQVARETHGRAVYVEGVCISPFGAMLHAWNVSNRTVIDRTWPMAHLNRYYGVPFSLEWLSKTGHLRYGCVFGYWEPIKDYLEKRARR